MSGNKNCVNVVPWCRATRGITDWPPAEAYPLPDRGRSGWPRERRHDFRGRLRDVESAQPPPSALISWIGGGDAVALDLHSRLFRGEREALRLDDVEVGDEAGGVARIGQVERVLVGLEGAIFRLLPVAAR